MKCEHCGAELVTGAKFCRECGTKVVQVVSSVENSVNQTDTPKSPGGGRSIQNTPWGKSDLHRDSEMKKSLDSMAIKPVSEPPKVERPERSLCSDSPHVIQKVDEYPGIGQVQGLSTGAVDDDYDGEVRTDSGASTIQSTKEVPGKSQLKRRTFIICGVVGGCLGAHFVYVKRWGLLALLWIGLILGGCLTPDDVSAEGGSGSNSASQVQPTASDKACEALGNVFIILWALMWIGGTIFIKKDGKGNELS